jgi:iron-sulfur cluster assembly protein
MLKLTESAAAEIKSLLKHAELSEGAGMRIVAEADENGEPGLHLSFEPEPTEGDQTVTEHGVNVFLDPSAADALDDKILDAHAHGDHSHFAIEDQAE